MLKPATGAGFAQNRALCPTLFLRGKKGVFFVVLNASNTVQSSFS
jgi:hypothetical protein